MPRPKNQKSGSPDNFQTDPRALDCLMPYIDKSMQIWEPACGNGNLVDSFKSRGFHRVYGSDILQGLDFLKFTPEFKGSYAIVTNPPFSKKEEFLGRCYQLGVPFALLMPITTFDSEQRRKMFAAHGIDLIFPAGRIHFETPNHKSRALEGKKSSAWFYSAWFTHGLNTEYQLNFTDNLTLKGLA